MSWRFWLEKFTQRALAAYFVPAGLEKVAYDMSAVPGAPAEVKVPVALRSRCALAIRNFNDSFQTDKRWVQNKSGVATDCTADGYYSTWGQSAAGMDKAVQAEAFKRMLGSGYSEANVAAFLTSALVVFGKVPRDFSPYPLAAMPPPEWGDGAWYNQPVKGMLNFFGWSANGDLAPLPPFSTAFLDLFAKGAATKVVAPVAFKMVPSGGQAAPAAPAAPAAHIVTAASARFVTPSAPRSRAVVYVAAAVGGAGLLLWLLLGLG